MGKFIMLIVVDEINSNVVRIINYMTKALKAQIYALELRYFNYKDGQIEILIPAIYGRIEKHQPPQPLWTWPRFVEHAKENVDEVTLATLHRLQHYIDYMKPQSCSARWISVKVRHTGHSDYGYPSRERR